MSACIAREVNLVTSAFFLANNGSAWGIPAAERKVAMKDAKIQAQQFLAEKKKREEAEAAAKAVIKAEAVIREFRNTVDPDATTDEFVCTLFKCAFVIMFGEYEFISLSDHIVMIDTPLLSIKLLVIPDYNSNMYGVTQVYEIIYTGHTYYLEIEKNVRNPYWETDFEYGTIDEVLSNAEVSCNIADFTPAPKPAPQPVPPPKDLSTARSLFQISNDHDIPLTDKQRLAYGKYIAYRHFEKGELQKASRECADGITRDVFVYMPDQVDRVLKAIADAIQKKVEND